MYEMRHKRLRNCVDALQETENYVEVCVDVSLETTVVDSNIESPRNEYFSCEGGCCWVWKL